MKSVFASPLLVAVAFICIAPSISLFSQVSTTPTWSTHPHGNLLGNNQMDSIVFSKETCSADYFQLLCATPYSGRSRPIDGSCGHCGQSGLTGDTLTAEFAQNFLKNNLCSSLNKPLPVITDDFDKLQQAVDSIPNFKYGNPHAGGFGPPADRKPLQALGDVNGRHLEEGLVVQFIGFMVEEHYSPSSADESGESVNCLHTDQPSVDIHIALGDKQERLPRRPSVADKEKILCPTITAEMIPHYRPDDWEYAQLESISDRQVRVTGQLFFDGSHRACGDPHRSSSDPKRRSSWEIHPVYSFEVCKHSGVCDPQKESDWQSIAESLKDTRATDDEE